MRVLVGHLKPDYGEVRVLGLDPWRDHCELMRRVGYLPEAPVVPSRATPWEVLKLVAKLKGSPLGEVRGLASRLGLESHLHVKVSSLSRGIIQRLMLACALIRQPSLLVLDEPLTHIDPGARYEVLEYLLELHEGSVDLIVASHILAELEELCDYLVVLYDGLALFTGTSRTHVAGSTPASRW